ncbi:MAG: hypothetical protein QXU11_03955 [Thermoproteota archaeon]
MVFTVIAVSLIAHELLQKLEASRLGLETTFKDWGSGILFGWLRRYWAVSSRLTAQHM